MAGFLGISYTTIVIAAIVPALLLRRADRGYRSGSQETGPKRHQQGEHPSGARGAEGAGCCCPLVIVIGTLPLGKTPIYAGLGIIAIIVASWLTPDSSVRMTPKNRAGFE